MGGKVVEGEMGVATQKCTCILMYPLLPADPQMHLLIANFLSRSTWYSRESPVYSKLVVCPVKLISDICIDC